MARLAKKQKEEIIKKYGKVPSKEEIFQKIRESQERLVASLIKAWEAAPDDPKIRKELLQAMERAVNLRKEVYKKLIKEEPPEIKESYEKLHKILEKEAEEESN